MKYFFASVAVFATVMLSFVAHGEMTAQSYVQDGLVGLWDAEENVGWGQHADAPSAWKDLSGVTGDLTLGSAGVFRPHAFEKTSEGLMAYRNVVLKNVLTVEAVVSDIPSSGWVVPFYATNYQMIAVSDSVRAARRTVLATYWGGIGLRSTDFPKVSSISAVYDYKSGRMLARSDIRQGNISGTNEGIGLEPLGAHLAVGCRRGATATESDYKTKGYRIHSIRLYNRVLTDEERSANAYVDYKRFGAALYRSVCTWTGGGHDGKFSTVENWKDSIVPALGVTNEIRLVAQDESAIDNDLGTLPTWRMSVTRASGSAALKLTGSSFVLMSPGGRGYVSKDGIAFTNGCPLTVEQDLTFSSGGDSVLYNGATLTLNGDLYTTSSNFTFSGLTTCTLNGKLIAPDTAVDGMENHHVYLKGPIAVKSFAGGNWGACDNFHFGATGNVIPSMTLGYYAYVYADVPYALPPNTVLRWTSTSYSTYFEPNRNAYCFRGDQLIDRIESTKFVSGAGWITDRGRLQADDEMTLTLRGTANASTYSAILKGTGPRMTLVWDPVGAYTQKFADQRHTMVGEIIVKGGTFASAGTNSFPSVTAVRVLDGATFAIVASSDNAASNPFTGETALWISGTGKLAIPSGVTVTPKPLFLDGALMPAGNYQSMYGSHPTAKRVSWITGTGSGLLTVGTVSGTSWAAAVDGDWNDAGKWTHGVPDGTKPVYVAAEGSPYTVTMKSGDVWPTALVIRGASSKLAVGAGQTVAYVGTDKTSSISIEEGGTLSAEGSLSLTEYVGTFTIGSADTSVTSRFSVSGSAVYAQKDVTTNYQIVLNPRGEIALPGGELKLVRNDNGSVVDQKGGSYSASGGGCLHLYAATSKKSNNTYFNTGTVLFDGTSVLKNSGKSPGMVWGPTTAGKSLHIAFRNQAVMKMGLDGFVLGRPNSTTVFDVGSDAVHTQFGNRMTVASAGTGTADLILRKGKITFGGRGFDVATTEATAAVNGRFFLYGGWVYNNSSNGAWTDQGKPNGFTVGYAASSTATSGTVAYGEYYQSGGTNQVRNSVTIIGAGCGDGRVVQTGGFYWHDSTSQVFGIGAAGGVGSWDVSNGTLRVKYDAYLGGFSKSILTKSDKMPLWPSDRHDADGTLVAAGGTIDLQKNLVLGADGRGTVTVFGSEGTLRVAKDLVLSNHVENASSGGTLNFICDENGLSPIEVTGKVVFRPGAKMTLNVDRYATRRRFRLITANGGMVDPLDPAAVEIVKGTSISKAAVVYRDEGGYVVAFPHGSAIVVR